jgi:prevent-host-death family protein
MKTMGAGAFKDQCLKTLDEVARDRTPVVITKRGRPVAKLVPVTSSTRQRTLAGSILRESGDPFSTAARWGADPA